ncbi:MAG: prepilin-type N-terminal cleavage/methylation domain-containing protein [Planctomycetes bacterium]|nr:prepilin-type N-terminal cleavage/methylation domain-containing protein [Planctomycetota bacterium]
MASRARATGAGARGFTLVEVVVALAILGLVAVVLLNQRVEVVRDAAKTRDQRLAWSLAAWKMGEIERETEIFMGEDSADSGTFEDYAPEYQGFVWEYEATREEVPTNDPENPDEKPKEIFIVKLKVRREGGEALIELQGMFPVGQTADIGRTPTGGTTK